MRPIIKSKELIAACGLYCGACKKYLKEKCPGCKHNEAARWCKIRRCCKEKGFRTCAECCIDVKQCKTYDNFIGKVFSFLFNSNRAACIHYIRAHGEEDFADKMVWEEKMTLERK